MQSRAFVLKTELHLVIDTHSEPIHQKPTTMRRLQDAETTKALLSAPGPKLSNRQSSAKERGRQSTERASE